MKNEISSTVKKLKESAAYYENVLKGNEEGYENEIESNEHTKAKNKAKEFAEEMEQKANEMKSKHFDKTIEYQNIDDMISKSLELLKNAKQVLNDTNERIEHALKKKEN